MNERQAIVIGGSMAGMLAARVLTEHFERVTVLERDRYPDRPEPRSGVPQMRHVHILLLRGKEILERLFPGLEAEMLDAGAHRLDTAADLRIFTAFGWKPRYRSGMEMLTFSRPLLDQCIHRRLATHPRVRFVEACEVVGLTAGADHARVTGVRYRLRNATQQEMPPEGTLPAALVVDASGRFSRTPEWLADLGYPEPEETFINPFLGYASRWYEVPAGFDADWEGLLLLPKAPEETRAGVLLPVEGDHWLVTLGGTAKDYPPTDEADFLDFARTLPHPAIYEAIQAARPASSIAGYRNTQNRWRHYARLPRWPDGYVVVGDALCAFNPIYGQGMTVAALDAVALDACLRDQQERRPGGDLTGLARRFQKQLADVLGTPWLMATGEDFRWPATEGGRPGLSTRLMHRYMDQVIAAATEYPDVDREFLRVSHLLAPPATLFHPRIVRRLIERRLR